MQRVAEFFEIEWNGIECCNIINAQMYTNYFEFPVRVLYTVHCLYLYHIVDRWLDGSEGFIVLAFVEIGICSFCKVSSNYSSLLIFARSMHLFKLSHDGNNLKFESVYGFMI